MFSCFFKRCGKVVCEQGGPLPHLGHIVLHVLTPICGEGCAHGDLLMSLESTL